MSTIALAISNTLPPQEIEKLKQDWQSIVVTDVQAAGVSADTARVALYKSLGNIYAFVKELLDIGAEKAFFTELKVLNKKNKKMENVKWGAVAEANPFRAYLNVAVSNAALKNAPSDSSLAKYAKVMRYAYFNAQVTDFVAWVQADDMNLNEWYKTALGNDQFSPIGQISKKDIKAHRYQEELDVALTEIASIQPIGSVAVTGPLSGSPGDYGKALIRIGADNTIELITLTNVGGTKTEREIISLVRKVDMETEFLRDYVLYSLFRAVQLVSRVSSSKSEIVVQFAKNGDVVVEAYSKEPGFTSGRAAFTLTDTEKEEVNPKIDGKFVFPKMSIDLFLNTMSKGANYSISIVPSNLLNPGALLLSIKEEGAYEVVQNGGKIVLPIFDGEGKRTNAPFSPKTQLSSGLLGPVVAERTLDHYDILMTHKKARRRKEETYKYVPAAEIISKNNEIVLKSRLGEPAIPVFTGNVAIDDGRHIRDDDLTAIAEVAYDFRITFKVDVCYYLKENGKHGSQNGLNFVGQADSLDDYRVSFSCYLPLGLSLKEFEKQNSDAAAIMKVIEATNSDVAKDATTQVEHSSAPKGKASASK